MTATAKGDPSEKEREATIDFERHIAPLLGRLGCNSAACHGAFGGGKGGFQLSLFGHSTKMDFLALEDRIDRSDPESSLLLLKPSGLLDHEGGVRFQPDSDDFRRVKRWIESGAVWHADRGRVKTLSVHPPLAVLREPVGSKQLVVMAEFQDGTHEEVTQLCQFTSRDEGVVLVDSGGQVTRSGIGNTAVIVAYGNAFASVSVLAPQLVELATSGIDDRLDRNPIDVRIHEQLQRLNIRPSQPSTDAAFLRRVMLDTIGAIPTPEEIRRFCTDDSPDKRQRKIDELLVHPMHAALWATRMCDITKCEADAMGDDDRLGKRRAQMWHDWFRVRFARNEAYDKIVAGILMATSREGQSVDDWMHQEEQLIHQARHSFENNYANRDTLDLYWRRTGPDRELVLQNNAELTAVAFLGVRLHCARCHKHPFDRWTQNDYIAFANVFSRTMFGSSDETNTAVLQELANRREAKRAGHQVAPLPRMREVFDSRELGRKLSVAESDADVAPRALDSDTLDEKEDLRDQFYQWLIAPENPYFARSFVNRVWAIYFGVGLVDPVDDFSVTNPPSHPELLDELAASFRATNFDIRELERRILMTAAYQRSSIPNETNLQDRRNFSRQQVRPLIAETTLDVLNQALGTVDDFGDASRVGSLAIEVGSNIVPGAAGRALQVLGRGTRQEICDCDRRSQSDLRQFMFLINDPTVAKKLEEGAIQKLRALDDETMVDELYHRILGRSPSQQETAIAKNHFTLAEHRNEAFNDLVWALINTREFITNH